MEEKIIKVLSSMNDANLTMFYRDFERIFKFMSKTQTYKTKDERENDNKMVKRYVDILQFYLNRNGNEVLNNRNSWKNIETVLSYNDVIAAYIRKRLSHLFD